MFNGDLDEVFLIISWCIITAIVFISNLEAEEDGDE